MPYDLKPKSKETNNFPERLKLDELAYFKISCTTPTHSRG
jgi:hypothetical protein